MSLSTPTRNEPASAHAALRERYVQARRDGASRHRDIAAALGISEGELIAVHVSARPRTEGLQARRLRAEWPAIIAALEPVGPVMALTRNAACVHEKTGVYRNASADGEAGREVGLVLAGDIDLRVFYARWRHGFAVDEARNGHRQRSLQFFDAGGTAIHKIFVRADTDLRAWDTLVTRFAAADQQAGLSTEPSRPRAAETPDTDIDVAALRRDWASMRDTHEFFGMLRRHGVSRTQALRLAEPAYVQPVDTGSAQRLLGGAAADGTSIMVFVGNPGMIQIHTGPVRRVEQIGPWLNVLDPGFNLHLREDLIESAAIVRKPTSDGLVSSLELFDAEGETIAMLFGERKPGRPELCAWRQLVDGLASDREPL